MRVKITEKLWNIKAHLAQRLHGVDLDGERIAKDLHRWKYLNNNSRGEPDTAKEVLELVTQAGKLLLKAHNLSSKWGKESGRR